MTTKTKVTIHWDEFERSLDAAQLYLSRLEAVSTASGQEHLTLEQRDEAEAQGEPLCDECSATTPLPLYEGDDSGWLVLEHVGSFSWEYGEDDPFSRIADGGPTPGKYGLAFCSYSCLMVYVADLASKEVGIVAAPESLPTPSTS